MTKTERLAWLESRVARLESAVDELNARINSQKEGN